MSKTLCFERLEDRILLAGSTIGTACDLGDFSRDAFIIENGNVNSGGDRIDGYRVDLNGSGFGRVTLAGLSADADLYLLNSNGDIIAQSTAGGTSTEIIDGNFRSGTYYAAVRYFPSVGSADYQLSIDLDFESSPTTFINEVGDSFGNIATPFNLGALPSDATIQLNGGTSFFDQTDAFQFTLNQTEQITFTPSTVPLQLAVGTLGGPSLDDNGPNFSQPFTKTLSPGTYIVSARPLVSGGQSYQLEIST